MCSRWNGRRYKRPAIMWCLQLAPFWWRAEVLSLPSRGILLLSLGNSPPCSKAHPGDNGRVLSPSIFSGQDMLCRAFYLMGYVCVHAPSRTLLSCEKGSLMAGYTLLNGAKHLWERWTPFSTRHAFHSSVQKTGRIAVYVLKGVLSNGKNSGRILGQRASESFR